MLPIICKGKGLIPRIGIIAPILTPFKVDKQTLTIIMKTPGSVLKPYFIDPITLNQTALTNTNFKSIYDNYEKQLTTPLVSNINIIKDTPIIDAPDNVIESIPVINQEHESVIAENSDADVADLNPINKPNVQDDVESVVDNISVVPKAPEVTNNNYNNYKGSNNYNNKNKNR